MTGPEAERGRLEWRRDHVAGVPLQRSAGFAGEVEVGFVEYDGGNRLWLWHGALAEDAWGWAGDEDGAKRALETWLKSWLENFRAFRP